MGNALFLLTLEAEENIEEKNGIASPWKVSYEVLSTCIWCPRFFFNLLVQVLLFFLVPSVLDIFCLLAQ